MARILIHALLALATLVTLAGATTPVAAGAAPAPTVPPPADEAPVVTANPFIPENVDLTTCVGTLPRPGCGSEERGGLHQNLVAVAMIGGLVIIFGRVAWGVRRSQRANRSDGATPPAAESAAP